VLQPDEFTPHEGVPGLCCENVGWVSGLVWRRRQGQNSMHSSVNESRFCGHSPHCLVTILSFPTHSYLLTFLLIYLLTYLLTPWSRVLLEKLTGSQLVKKFPHFTEPEGSLPHSPVPPNCPYPETDQSSSCTPPHFLKIHLGIILPFTPGSSKWSLSVRFPDQIPAYTSFLPHTCYMPRQSYSRFYHPNDI